VVRPVDVQRVHHRSPAPPRPGRGRSPRPPRARRSRPGRRPAPHDDPPGKAICPEWVRIRGLRWVSSTVFPADPVLAEEHQHGGVPRRRAVRAGASGTVRAGSLKMVDPASSPVTPRTCGDEVDKGADPSGQRQRGQVRLRLRGRQPVLQRVGPVGEIGGKAHGFPILRAQRRHQLLHLLHRRQLAGVHGHTRAVGARRPPTAGRPPAATPRRRRHPSSPGSSRSARPGPPAGPPRPARARWRAHRRYSTPGASRRPPGAPAAPDGTGRTTTPRRSPGSGRPAVEFGHRWRSDSPPPSVRHGRTTSPSSASGATGPSPSCGVGQDDTLACRRRRRTSRPGPGPRSCRASTHRCRPTQRGPRAEADGRRRTEGGRVVAPGQRDDHRHRRDTEPDDDHHDQQYRAHRDPASVGSVRGPGLFLQNRSRPRSWPPASADGHPAARTQPAQSGRRAWHTRRPWKISRCENIVHSFFSTRAVISRSTATASVCVVSPSPTHAPARRACPPGNPGTPKALPSTTFAVLRPTPGRATSSSIDPGTSPPCSSHRAVAETDQARRLVPEETRRTDELLQPLPVGTGVGRRRPGTRGTVPG
jgi:hypothetical protein